MSEKKKRIIDWDAIERDYRVGIKTLREIAAENSISHQAIAKKAKQFEWTRDLSVKIKQKADELVARSLVAKIVTKDDKLTELVLIKSKAELQAGALLQESDEIKRLSDIADGFEEELKGAPVNEAGIPIDLERRTKILKQLSEIREKIINLRRRNFGINDNANGDADQKRPIDLVEYEIVYAKTNT